MAFGTGRTYNRDLRTPSQKRIAKAEADAAEQDVRMRNQLFQALLGGSGGGGGFSFGGSFGGGGEGGEGDIFSRMQELGEARIGDQFEDVEKQLIGSLASRGLGSSSLQASVPLGVQREKQRALGGLEESLLGKKLDFGQQQQQMAGSIFSSLLGNLFR